MSNGKRISIIATFLMAIGIIGIMFTYKSAFSKEAMVTEEQVIEGDFNDLNIEIDNGSVEVHPTSDGEVSLTLEARNPEDILNTDVSEDELSIIVKGKRKKWFNFGFRNPTPELNVYVPEKVLTTFNMRSNNGRLTAENIQSEKITASTDNGRIDVTNVSGSTIEAQTNNGKIHLTNTVADDTTASAHNGKIVYDHVDGELVGRVNNGAILLKTDHIDRDIDFKTSNGKIDIDTEQKPTNAILDVQVANGKVRVFGDSTWDTVIGDGDHMVELTTTNGKITIE